MDKAKATKIATVVVMVVSLAVNALQNVGAIDTVASPCVEQAK